jgi:hypothetical protein
MGRVLVRPMVLLLAVIAAAQTSGHLPDLRCELRASDHAGMWFSPDQRSHLHFLLFSNRAGVEVYEDWNSWGYFARSFIAKDEHSRIYEITRRESGWDKNYPSTDTLNTGDVLITDIFLCDGTRRVSPKLPKGPTVNLQLLGRFTMKEEKNGLPTDAWTANVWTGQIESAPVELHLDRHCVDALNTEGQ